MKFFPHLIVLLSGSCLTAPYSATAEDSHWPDPHWAPATPAEVGMDRAQLKQARDYALTGGGSGYITRHGRLVMHWGDPTRRYDLKSTTKSIAVTALGLAITDQKIELADRAAEVHPSLGVPPQSNAATGWIDSITIQHLATQTAGFEKPGGYTRLASRPGAKWSYSDGGPNWLAECITLLYRQDLDELMFQRVFTPLHITRDDLTWRQHAYRDKKINGITRREFGSGISANVDAMARLGYLYLRGGKWNGTRLIADEFVRAAGNPVEDVVDLPVVDPDRYGNASQHYGLLWWNNADGTLAGVPRDAYWSWGLYDSLIVVIPSLDIVVARAGKSWNRDWDTHYDVLKPFLEPIAKSIREDDPPQAPADRPLESVDPSADDEPRYPPSPVIRGIEWSPPSTIVRRAKGSDNWPITWGDDDRLYTAYGDGRGFEPFTETKLSLGLAVISGAPDNFHAENLRSPTAERIGDGPRGAKASGLLMVDGTLYMLARNTGNAQLVWSTDHGRTWTWSDWKFNTSFGYPTFLNYGKNYQGARDHYVYIYSHDSDSAYHRSDSMVLARVPQDRITDHAAYSYYKKSENGAPLWTDDIDRRGPLFTRKGRCYRSSVSYNAALKRYLWCQTGMGDDTRFRGGFAIYDAPQPWGPWTIAFETDEWDVGPGETSCLPTKWISDDGRTIHLVFSGDDAFSVRRGAVLLRE